LNVVVGNNDLFMNDVVINGNIGVVRSLSDIVNTLAKWFD